MEYLGQHINRKVYWCKDSEFKPESLPTKDWVWFCVANENVTIDSFEILQRVAIKNNLLEFKGAGTFGGMLHDFFDEIVVGMEVLEHHPKMNIMTTLHDDETLDNAFWACFYVTCLPQTADLDNITIICTDLNNGDRKAELKGYLERFNDGWIPTD